MRDDRSTPAWFWPVFSAGVVLACVAIIASGLAGAGLIAARIATMPRAGSAPTPTYVPTAPPRVAPPPWTPPPSSPSPLAQGLAPSPTDPAEAEEGTLLLELVVHDSHGRRAPRRGERCTLTIDFAWDDAVGDDAVCSGELACGDRAVWRVGSDAPIDCRVDRDRGALDAHDAGFSADDGTPLIDLRAGAGGATVSVADDARGARGAYSFVAASD